MIGSFTVKRYLLCRIKVNIFIKAQDVVEKSKNISLYCVLGVTDSGTEFSFFDFDYAKGFPVADTSGV